MPKSKKKKRQDFQKVKLKVGKKLPKGDNVTNLSFKTRQIQLTQRIKDDAGQDLVSKKKLSIQELLRQCDHHSTSSRVDAVAGLKELWLSNSEDLLTAASTCGYDEIIKKISTLLIDNEAVVRHSAINLFKLILKKLSKKTSGTHKVDKLGGSLYTYIHVYLCCAMNHMHEDIKLDGLVLFDALMDTFPHLMVQQTGDLLKNLVGLISLPSYLGAKGDSTTQRLSLNPDSKLPAMKFRARVLQRIKRAFVEALEDQTNMQNPAELLSEDNKTRSWSLYGDHKGPSAKQNTLLNTYAADRKFGDMFLGGSHELDDYITKPSSLLSFIKLSVPVLLQCWREARASVDTHSASDNVVSPETVEVMSLVVCIIQLMFVLCASHQRHNSHPQSADAHLVSPDELVKNYQQDFIKLFMNNFPYSVQVQAQKSKKRKRNQTSAVVENAASQTCLTALNLAICDIMASFCTSSIFMLDQKCIKKVESHLVRCLQKPPSVEQSKILTRILKNIFSNTKAVGNCSQGYSAAVQCYKACSIKAPQKRLFYNLFAWMVQTWDGWERKEESSWPIYKYSENSAITVVLEEFLHDLPSLLLEVSRSGGDRGWILGILTFMANGHVQNCSQKFLQIFREKLEEILDPVIGVIAHDDECIQQKLFALIALGTPLNQDHLKHILSAIRRPVDKPLLHRRKSWSIVSHAIYSVISSIKKCVPLDNQTMFSNMTSDQHSQLSDYLKFMFSLQTGMSATELEELCPKVSSKEDTDGWLTVDFTVQGDQWDRHVEIANVVAREVASFSIPALPSEGYQDKFSLLTNMEQLWKQALAERSSVHILTAYSLVQLCYHMSTVTEENPSEKFYDLASHVMASVLMSIYHHKDSGRTLGEEMVWKIKEDVVHCLTKDLRLLDLVMALLTQRSQESSSATEEDRQASSLAKDFLHTDDSIREKLNMS